MEQIISTFIKELFHQPPIFWIIVGSGILLAIFHNRVMGYMGEFCVNRELNKLPKDKYRILKDIMIKIDDRTCQIDHIVVSHYGIFVIETKNYSGLITGSSKSEKWCMHLGKNKYYFHNPLYQNYGHIKALESLLNINDNKFISIISISNRAKIKVNEKNVINLDYLLDTIKTYNENILDANIDEIANIIKSNNITNKEERKKHVANIKITIADKTIKEENMICPKCGSKLIIRDGKNGKFIGCTNYPKCRFTKNIEK